MLVVNVIAMTGLIRALVDLDDGGGGFAGGLADGAIAGAIAGVAVGAFTLWKKR